MLKARYIVFFWLFFLYPPLYSQITSEQVKATFILRFCENVDWRNIPETIKIGCLTTDDVLYNFLKPAEKDIKIHKKPVQVIRLQSINNLQDVNAIYYNGNSMDELVTLFNYAKENNVLLITDGIEDELFVHINFNNEPENVSFSVNMPNLALAGFEVKPNLLLNGGSVVDINKAYQRFEERLNDSKEKLDAAESALKMAQTELQEKNLLIQEKEKTLNSYVEDINSKEAQSNALQSTLQKERKRIELQREELSKSQNDLLDLKKDIELKESEFKKLESDLKILESESDKLQNEISDKNIVLSEQEDLISTQRKMLLLFLTLAAALIVIGITLYRLFSLKKKSNILLEQKVNERTHELQKSERNYREIFNGVSDYILIQDEQGKILTVNEPMLKAYGYTQAEVEHLDVGKLSDETRGYTNEKAAELFQITKANGQHTFDWIAKRKNGETFWVIVTLKLTVIGGYNRLLALVRDNDINKKNELELEKHRNNLEKLVKEKTEDLEAANEELQSTNEELFDKNDIINNQNTELKATLQHLKETQAQLLQSEKMASLGILTAGVAHEINNPLNYIMGAYEGLRVLEEEKKDNEQISILLNALKTGVERASNIVKSLNQFSRNTWSSNENCDVHEIIDNSLVMLQNRLKNRVKIKKEFAAESALISGNVGNIHQVFLNILSNAEQAIEGEGQISIKTLKDKDNIYIEIADDGCGIAKEDLNKITDPFYTTKEPGKGTGLGLSITYNIISEHGGSLNFESELHKGTTANILLPLKNSIDE